MTQTISTDKWISVINTWKINSITDSYNRKFMFYHIRTPEYKVELSESTLSNHCMNQTRIIAPKQVSLILGIANGAFNCVTIISNHVDKKTRFLQSDYECFKKLGQAAIWYLHFDNFYHGPWEVFNGPNPIILFD